MLLPITMNPQSNPAHLDRSLLKTLEISSPAKYIPRLDVLRAIAILCVFFFHSHEIWLEQNLINAKVDFFHLFSFGWIGVPIFFVLSGFVIQLSFLNSKKFTVIEFYQRRFWRIYPSYFLALVTFTVLEDRSLKQFITHALLIHNLRGGWFFAINPSFWTLAVESQFYLLYPLILIARRKIGMFKTLLLTIAIAGLARGLAELILGSQSLYPVITSSTLATWPCWCLGAFVAENYFRQTRTFNFPPYVNAIAIILSAVLINHSRSVELSYLLASLAAALCLEGYIYVKGNLLLIEKMLIPLGLCSYSFYLWHQPILMALNKMFVRFESMVPTWGFFIIYLFISFTTIFMLSWILYKTIETGTRKWGWKSSH
jgi:peptidoglycan/LPS O-acetylase OafA/YrhL